MAAGAVVCELATQGVGRVFVAFPPIQVQPGSAWQSLQVFSTVQALEQTSMAARTGIPVLALQVTSENNIAPSLRQALVAKI